MTLRENLHLRFREFPKTRGYLTFGVLITRILLLRVLYIRVPEYSETPMWVVVKRKVPFWVP